MKLWSNMDWFRVFYAHLCSCVQEHACAHPHAWWCALSHFPQSAAAVGDETKFHSPSTK